MTDCRYELLLEFIEISPTGSNAWLFRDSSDGKDGVKRWPKKPSRFSQPLLL